MGQQPVAVPPPPRAERTAPAAPVARPAAAPGNQFDTAPASNVVPLLANAAEPEGLTRLKHLADPFRDENPPPPPDDLKSRLAALGPGASHLTSREAAAALGHASWAPALEALGQPAGEGKSFVLAARLSLFMERAFKGATVDELGELFARATPGAEATFGTLDGAYLRALQQAYPFMPQWQTAPGPTASGDDWFASPSASNLHAERLTHALEQLNEISFDMPITRSAGERLAQTRPFAKANVVLVQHVLGQASGMVNALVAGGLDGKKSEFVGIPYQSGQPITVAVEAQSGMPMTIPDLGDIDGMWKAVGDAIDRAVARHRENGEPILVMDDGGYASKYIVQKYPELQSAFRVVEQTTRGLTELSALDLGFPVVNVAGSYGKRLESAQIGEAIISSVSTILSSLATGLHDRPVLVLGAGKVGTETARAAKAHGAKSVAVYDPYLTPHQRQALEAEGFRVITDKAEALKDKFLVVGTSGHQSIDLEDFTRLASSDADRPVFIAQGSSKHVEIDHVGLLSQATDAQGRLRRILAAKVNDQETYHYWLNDGRMLTALANDLPVNFQDINSVAPADIDHVMALMITGAAQALKATGKGLQPLDEAAQFHIQAQDLGLHSRAEGPGEVGIVIGGQRYAGTLDQWRAVSTSIGSPPIAMRAVFQAFAAHAPGSPENQLALACLGPPHELSDAHVDEVLAQALDQIEVQDAAFGVEDEDADEVKAASEVEFLPALGQLLGNDALTGEQRAKVSDFVQTRLTYILERAFKAAERTPVEDPRLRMAERRPVRPTLHEFVKSGVMSRMPHTTLLLKLALTAPDCPASRLQAFLDDPSVFRAPTPANVFVAQNPRLTSAQLDALAKEAFQRLELCVPFPTYGRYLFDLTESFASNPNASPQLRETMQRTQTVLTSLSRGTPLGSHLWPTKLGQQLPMYVSIGRTEGRLDKALASRPLDKRMPPDMVRELMAKAREHIRTGAPL